LKYFDAFSGYGGFHLGIERALDDNNLGRTTGSSDAEDGWDKPLSTISDGARGRSHTHCIGYSEIDKYASAVYKYHFGGGDESLRRIQSNDNEVEQTSNDSQNELQQRELSDNRGGNYGDITKIDPTTIPDFDLFCGGFPCQAFSIAGKRGGFDDTRGTLIYDVFRILKEKQPRFVLLENVKGLLSHDSGRTFKVIISSLAELGYSVEWQVLNAKNFGVPQNRERVFIIGHLGGFGGRQVFPIRETNPEALRQIIGGSQGFRVYDPNGIACTQASQAGGLGAKTGLYVSHVDRTKGEYALRETERAGCLTSTMYKGIDASGRTGVIEKVIPVLTPDRLEKRQNGRRFKTDGEPMFTLNTQDKHGVYDGYKIRRLTPTECERLMGLPDGWTKYGDFDGEIREISDTQRYKLCGNGVVVNVVEEIIKRLYEKNM
jgi:DNA (cytosine-5)-methyltransferase 1